MHVLIFENNLMWSARLVKSLQALGHTAQVLPASPENLPEAQAAIVNLGSPEAANLVPTLKAQGIYVIAHAGHKEKELRQLGKDLAVDRLASNSELTFKLAQLLPM